MTASPNIIKGSANDNIIMKAFDPKIGYDYYNVLLVRG